MKPTHLTNIISLFLAASAILLTGCATAFVRSSATSFDVPVYPATAFDAKVLWECGVRGKPPMAMADPKQKSPPAARAAFIFGSIIDFPLSIAFDTLLLPLDLIRMESSDEKKPLPIKECKWSGQGLHKSSYPPLQLAKSPASKGISSCSLTRLMLVNRKSKIVNQECNESIIYQSAHPFPSSHPSKVPPKRSCSAAHQRYRNAPRFKQDTAN